MFYIIDLAIVLTSMNPNLTMTMHNQRWHSR